MGSGLDDAPPAGVDGLAENPPTETKYSPALNDVSTMNRVLEYMAASAVVI